ncbi:MAG: hypothetical protein ACLRSW_14330 [Christensenellaceae bacterium]
MPLPVTLSQKRHALDGGAQSDFAYLRPDGKTRVTVEYDDKRRARRCGGRCLPARQGVSQESCARISKIRGGQVIANFSAKTQKFTSTRQAVSSADRRIRA